VTTRLLIVDDDFVAGGAFMVGERLARGLAAAYRVVFACDLSPVNRAARLGLVKADVEVVRLFAHAGEMRRALYDRGSACALLQRARPDKILFVDSSPRSNLAVKDAAREAGLPYVSVINFIDRETPPALKIYDADVVRAANAAAANVFVSAAARAEFETNFPGVAAPRLVVANGVPDEFFKPSEPETREELRRELGVDAGEVMLLLPGRLEPRKGQGLALAALAALAARGDEPRLRLFFAGFGDAEAKSALERQIRTLNLADRVCYLGPRRDLPQLLDACDIVLMPSYQEADGLVSKEAMAKGRPVVASDLKSVREQGHADAFLIPAPDGAPEKTVEALAAVIDGLRRDARRRDEAGRNLHAIAEQRFTLAQMVTAYLRILEAAPAHDPAHSHECAAPPVGRWIPVSQPHRAGPLFKDGWSEFECGGIWSLGARSRIAFALPRPATHVEVACKVSTFAAAGHVRAFDVIANGRKAATWTFARGRREMKTVRIASPFPKRVFVVSFRLASPVSPFELGLNEDRRKLGLFMHALRIGVAAGGGGFWAGRMAGVLRRVAGRSRP
jgi:glycosyltransferase involved in cell wall biosynthesis